MGRPVYTAEPATSTSLVLAGNRSTDVVVFEEQVVDFFISAADLLGVPKSVAAIYGIVFASPAPLSFAEIETRLNISKGSVSQGLRVLRDVGALREVSNETDRAELFTPDLEMRKLIQRFLEQRLEKQLDSGKGRLKELNRSLPELKSSDTETLRQRLRQLQGWHDKARALVPVARTFLKLS